MANVYMYMWISTVDMCNIKEKLLCNEQKSLMKTNYKSKVTYSHGAFIYLYMVHRRDVIHEKLHHIYVKLR